MTWVRVQVAPQGTNKNFEERKNELFISLLL